MPERSWWLHFSLRRTASLPDVDDGLEDSLYVGVSGDDFNPDAGVLIPVGGLLEGYPLVTPNFLTYASSGVIASNAAQAVANDVELTASAFNVMDNHDSIQSGNKIDMCALRRAARSPCCIAPICICA